MSAVIDIDGERFQGRYARPKVPVLKLETLPISTSSSPHWQFFDHEVVVGLKLFQQRMKKLQNRFWYFVQNYGMNGTN